jgi:ABC-type nitrate/sulfonate/bicarbonate transport system ATPase subunit
MNGRDQSTAIAVNRVSFAYSSSGSNNGNWLYDSFSFKVPQGAIMAIMGASGSGKSTLGKLIAGIIKSQTGDVHRSEVLGHPQDVVYVDQHPMNSVFPWQTVHNNLAYPLAKLKWNPSQSLERIKMLLASFHLEHLADAFPANLSGGELQRLALARCFSWRPRLIVLDEAFASLDRKIKEGLQATIVKIALEEKTTLVMMTHNIIDVLSTCTHCVVIGGRPVGILASLELGDADGRSSASAGYQAAEQKLLELVRNGTL